MIYRFLLLCLRFFVFGISIVCSSIGEIVNWKVDSEFAT